MKSTEVIWAMISEVTSMDALPDRLVVRAMHNATLKVAGWVHPTTSSAALCIARTITRTWERIDSSHFGDDGPDDFSAFHDDAGRLSVY